MTVPLPWERVLWRGRSAYALGARYLVTDFRIVRHSGADVAELAHHDVGEVHCTRSRLDRLLGTTTVVALPRDPRNPSIALRGITRGPQLAALIDLLAGAPDATVDPDEAVRSTLAWDLRPEPRVSIEAIIGVMVVLVAIAAAAVALHRRPAPAPYAADDPIYPSGRKADRATIVRFMQAQVMPWARVALAPIVDGADRVTCDTCHGREAAGRAWQMPAVAALPAPDVRVRGWEQYSNGMDAQMRNAIYGYLAESDKQAKATYMREVVLPGMARLLRRPPYDFTKTYGYNRSRGAFGCYHCHRVK